MAGANIMATLTSPNEVGRDTGNDDRTHISTHVVRFEVGLQVSVAPLRR